MGIRHKFAFGADICEVCGFTAEMLTELNATDECAGVHCCSGEPAFAEWVTRHLRRWHERLVDAECVARLNEIMSRAKLGVAVPRMN